MLIPRRTIRLRLTALYAALFLASGAGLLAVTYVLVDNHTPMGISFTGRQARGEVQVRAVGAGAPGIVSQLTMGHFGCPVLRLSGAAGDATPRAGRLDAARWGRRMSW